MDRILLAAAQAETRRLSRLLVVAAAVNAGALVGLGLHLWAVLAA